MTKQIDDGGPAFPHHEVWDDDKTDIGWIGGGMSLRDWFAGQALSVLPHPNYFPDPTVVAERAYAIADAMLEARRLKQ